MTKMVQDPVCHMTVSEASFSAEYAGIHYAFCSNQCRNRFLANPHLYTGLPGHMAPAQKGNTNYQTTQSGAAFTAGYEAGGTRKT